MGLHSVSDLYAMLQYSLTHVTMASGGDVNFPKCNDFEPLVANDTTESSSLSEQFSDASSL